ncbi:hypothetical protein [Lysinibacter cavernae]|uniref:Uncharacterized protein n=1 Tax=Lysinibacter cavernae TaxID=1640652 RepID=A0A7X5QZ52_9MICO|nr:hypothetical protein [Lysinibacter cavernae]NIH52457.1 hypothetical protein [Lysinibacter cavernae]
MSLQATSAAYVDKATANPSQMGSGALVTQVKNMNGQWIEATTPAAAEPILPANGAQASIRGFGEPMVANASVRLVAGSPTADITPTLTVPTGCVALCAESLGFMLFTVELDGGVPLGTDLTFAQVNALGTRTIRNAVAGAEHTLSISVYMSETTPVKFRNVAGNIGIQFNAVSVPS